MQGWGPIPLTAVLSNGNITQLYPAWASSSPGVSAGAAIPTSPGQLYRRPVGGRFGQISVETDSTDAGIIQLFDASGLDALADVSSGTTITNAQMTTLLNANKAKLIWEQNFASAPGAPIVWNWQQGFLRGLAARYISSVSPASGTCKLNVIGEGGFQYLNSAGVYSGG